MNPGILFGLGAYLAWGLFPLYFRLLQRVSALELVAHRVVWSALLLAMGLVATGRLRRFFASTKSGRVWAIHAISALLIGINWLVYVWGVNHGRVVECSLGYFLNPLVSIGLGVLVLGERLRRAQWAGVVLAGIGIACLAVGQGGFPWISVALALSFGTYGLLKKRAPLDSLYGLFAETLVLFLPALVWIAFREVVTSGPLNDATGLEWTLVIGTGLITTIPLLLFSMSTRRIPLSMVGFIQYLTPSLQFVIGVFVFNEVFSAGKLRGFLLVWSGLAVVVIDGIWKTTRARRMR